MHHVRNFLSDLKRLICRLNSRCNLWDSSCLNEYSDFSRPYDLKKKKNSSTAKSRITLPLSSFVHWGQQMFSFALPLSSAKINLIHVALRGRGGGGQLAADITVFQLQVRSWNIEESLLVSKRLYRTRTSAVRKRHVCGEPCQYDLKCEFEGKTWATRQLFRGLNVRDDLFQGWMYETAVSRVECTCSSWWPWNWPCNIPLITPSSLQQSLSLKMVSKALCSNLFFRISAKDHRKCFLSFLLFLATSLEVVGHGCPSGYTFEEESSESPELCSAFLYPVLTKASTQKI